MVEILNNGGLDVLSADSLDSITELYRKQNWLSPDTQALRLTFMFGHKCYRDTERVRLTKCWSSGRVIKITFDNGDTRHFRILESEYCEKARTQRAAKYASCNFKIKVQSLDELSVLQNIGYGIGRAKERLCKKFRSVTESTAS